MAFTPDQINQARQHGYSDTEIAQFLSGPKYQAATQAGYNDSDIINHFAGVQPTPPKFYELEKQPGIPGTPMGLAKQVGRQFLEGATSPMPGSLLSVPLKAVSETSQQIGSEVAKRTAPSIGTIPARLAGFAASAATDPLTYSGGLAKMSPLASAGTEEALSASGIRANTIRKMARAGENPADLANEIGGKLIDNEALGKTPSETFDKLTSLKNQVGKKIEGIINEITPSESDKPVTLYPASKSGEGYTGGHTWGPYQTKVMETSNQAEREAIMQEAHKNVGFVDPSGKFYTVQDYADLKQAGKANVVDVPRGNSIPEVHPDTQKALQPLLDSAQERESAMTSEVKNTAKPFREIYDGLVKKAKGNNGELSLSHIREALDEAGRTMSKGSEEARGTASELYGELANVRDNMVENLAKNSNDPQKATILKTLNREYSQYLRILPDVKLQAAKEGVGKMSLTYPVEFARQAVRPALAKTLYGAGQVGIPTGSPASLMERAGFPLSQQNYSELQSVRDRLKNESK